MPTPNPKESRQDFMSRCIPILEKEGRPMKQCIAMCSSMYDKGTRKQEDFVIEQDKEYVLGYPTLDKK